jgi:hypothetical protein
VIVSARKISVYERFCGVKSGGPHRQLMMSNERFNGFSLPLSVKQVFVWLFVLFAIFSMFAIKLPDLFMHYKSLLDNRRED